MSESSPRRDTAYTEAEWQDLLEQLNAIRLRNDWSYRQLADDIKRVSTYEISAQTLQPMLSGSRDERPKPYDRTIFKIREYLRLAAATKATAAR
jgi:hypothetical protein